MLYVPHSSRLRKIRGGDAGRESGIGKKLKGNFLDAPLFYVYTPARIG